MRRSISIIFGHGRQCPTGPKPSDLYSCRYWPFQNLSTYTAPTGGGLVFHRVEGSDVSVKKLFLFNRLGWPIRFHVLNKFLKIAHC